MDKFMSVIEKFLLPIADKLNNNRYLTALRDSFMLALPLIMFGSIFVVIANLPYLNKIMGTSAYTEFSSLLGPASNSTMSIMTLFVVFGLGYYISKSYKVEPVYGAAVAVAAFLILTPSIATSGKVSIDNVFSFDRLGAKGMFVGILAGILSAEIYRRIVQKNWIIKMPEGVPEAVSKSFSALIPAFLTLFVFLLVRILFTFTPWGNIHDFIYKVIQMPLMSLGSSLPATLVAIFFTQIFWFFGLHGQILMNSVMDPIWRALSLENLTAHNAGHPLPHIICKQFMDTFTVSLGGTGMTLAVVVMILMLTKSKQLKELAKLAIGPGIFNVNEPVIFGLPIVLNPLILIPWFLAPMVAVTVAYFSMAVGLVPAPIGADVPWTVPIFFSGILATGSLAGGILQLVEFAIVFLIWLPFIISIDRKYRAEEARLRSKIEEQKLQGEKIDLKDESTKV